MDRKQCSKCKQWKASTDFGKASNTKDRLRYDCKQCRKQYNIETREAKKRYNQQYYTSNKTELLGKAKVYRQENVDEIREQRKQYRANNKEHISIKNREYLPTKKQKIKERRLIDMDFRLAEIVRSKVHRMLKGIKTSYTSLVGCNIETLHKWLEFQFDESMNWNNLGIYWHIDHILPINGFDFSHERDKNICFNWTNLQPLQKDENRSKSDKLMLHYYFNSIVSAHRFIQKEGLDTKEYQNIRESVYWLREKLRYGKNLFGDKDNSQPKLVKTN